MGIPFLFPSGARIPEDVLSADGEVGLIRMEREPYGALVHALGRSSHLMFRFTDAGVAPSVPELHISTDSLEPPAQLVRNWRILTGEGCRLPRMEAGLIAQALYEAAPYTVQEPWDDRSLFLSGEECDIPWI